MSDSPASVALRAALAPMVEAAIEALRAESRAWAEGLRQDAVESAPRIGRLRQNTAGVRVPVHALYFVHSRRRAEAAARALVERAAAQQARPGTASAARLMLIGNGLLEALPERPVDLDITVKRDIFEAEGPWRRRFESTVRAQVEHVQEALLVAHLRALGEALVIAWAPCFGAPSLSPAPGRCAG